MDGAGGNVGIGVWTRRGSGDYNCEGNGLDAGIGVEGRVIGGVDG